jgi:hypothetical protein
MKTRTLNFDAFRANQLTSIQQKSINGGVGANGLPEIPAAYGDDPEGSIDSSGPTGQQNTVPGSIKPPVVGLPVYP